MIITSSFHDSDWISIISDADRHYFRVRTAITLSPMPLNELWGGWKWVLWVCVAQRQESRDSISVEDDLQELRCLFVREGWSEYFLWLDFHHFRCGSSLFPCSHSDNALSNAAEWALRWMRSGCVWHKERSHVPLDDHLKKRRRAPMSIRERGMKWVLPVIVTSSLYSNACGRYTSVRLGMSKHHFIVDENHSPEWCDEDNGMCHSNYHQFWV